MPPGPNLMASARTVASDRGLLGPVVVAASIHKGIEGIDEVIERPLAKLRSTAISDITVRPLNGSSESVLVCCHR